MPRRLKDASVPANSANSADHANSNASGQQQQQPPSSSGQGVNDASHGSISGQGSSTASRDGVSGASTNGSSGGSSHGNTGTSGSGSNSGNAGNSNVVGTGKANPGSSDSNSDNSENGKSGDPSGNSNSGNGNAGGSSGNGNAGNSGNGNSGGAAGNGRSSENPGNAPAAPDHTCNGSSPQCTGDNSGGNSGGKPAGGPSRGDDPRPRNWDKENNRGETAFDDRKSPRTVGFLGRSANVRIYPNYSDPSVYLQLRFGKIQELDAAGQPVPGHMVPSLADAANVTFTAGNTTINGVNMSYVNVSLNPVGREGFTLGCKARGVEDDGEDALESLKPASRPAAVGRPHSRSLLLEDVPPAPMPAPPLYAYSAPPPLYGGGGGDSGIKHPQLAISVFFGLDDGVTLPYGNVNITVPRNGLKWTVSVKDWPFCNVSNTLSVSLQLLVANNASAQVASDAANNGTQTLQIVLGSAYNATLGFLDYALDGAAGANANATRMPVNVSLLGQGEQGVTTVAMGLPNPAAYGVSSGNVWYDPTQTSTSIYLAVDDPGNALVTYRTVAVQNSGNVTSEDTASGGGTGAATALRTTMWTIAAAVLLGMFMGGPHVVP